MIKAIMFDWGGVISKEGTFKGFFEENGPELGFSPIEMRDISRKYWLRARVNEIPSSAYWEGCSKELGISKELFREKFLKHMGTNQATIELTKKLKGKYKLVMISNQIEDWLEERIIDQGLDKIFDVYSNSYQVGYAKPDPNFFKAAIKNSGVKPEEAVCIDDKEDYLVHAKELGLNIIIFKSAEQVEEDLRSLGVNV